MSSSHFGKQERVVHPVLLRVTSPRRADVLRKVRGERAPTRTVKLKGKKHSEVAREAREIVAQGGKEGSTVKNCTSAYISPATSEVILAISRAGVGTQTRTTAPSLLGSFSLSAVSLFFRFVLSSPLDRPLSPSRSISPLLPSRQKTRQAVPNATEERSY